MGSPRMNDLFAIFFDPRVPLTFVLGSIVLAVLGNGVYSLIVDLLGETPYKLWYIVIGALLIFVAITLVSWAWLRTRHLETVSMPNEHQADACAGLILLMSPRAGTSEEVAIEYHRQRNTLRHCWMLTSPEASMKAQRLASELGQHNIQTSILLITDENQAALTYEMACQAIAQATQALGDQSLIVDITGGTKPMTAGATLACLVRGAPMEYMVPRRKPDGT